MATATHQGKQESWGYDGYVRFLLRSSVVLLRHDVGLSRALVQISVLFLWMAVCCGRVCYFGGMNSRCYKFFSKKKYCLVIDIKMKKSRASLLMDLSQSFMQPPQNNVKLSEIHKGNIHEQGMKKIKVHVMIVREERMKTKILNDTSAAVPKPNLSWTSNPELTIYITCHYVGKDGSFLPGTTKGGEIASTKSNTFL